MIGLMHNWIEANTVALIVAGYATIPTTAVVSNLIMLKMYLHRNLSADAKRLLFYIMHINAAITVRIGWFVCARACPSNGWMLRGEPYNQFLWENKVYMALVTAAWFFWASYKLLNEIKSLTWFEKSIGFALVLFNAVFLGWWQ